MNLSLNDKRALVCGSSRGIGKAAAIELAALGAAVTLFARDADLLSRVAGELPTPHDQKHTFITADFHDTAVVARVVHEAVSGDGPFHILINNTGGPPAGQAINADPDEYEKAFRLHVLTNQVITQAVVPGMREAKYGRIINVISTSVKAPIPNLGVSNTIRGAVASWAKTLASELAPDGITVNNVLPGFTETDRLDAILSGRAAKAGVSEDEIADSIKATIPARRFARAEEVGAAIAFLATPAAAYINGINVPVDGGRTPSL